MKLNESIPVLDRWHDSRAGQVTKKLTKATPATFGMWPLYIVISLAGIAFLYLDKTWSMIIFVITLVLLIIMAILILAAKDNGLVHSSDAEPLSESEKNQIMRKLHGEK